MADDSQQEFLRADFEHVAASLLQNEELGEKRVTFFTGIVTAFFSGIGFVTTEMKEVVPVNAYLAALVVSCFLLVMGGLTLLRLKRRNYVTDQLKDVLKRMREAGGGSLTESYRDLFDKKPTPRKKRPVWNGGLFHVAGALTLAVGVVFGWSGYRFWHAQPAPVPPPTCKCCTCQECSK
jgi:hypothetical protein